MDKDIGGTTDVAAKHPEIVKKVKELFKDTRTEHPGFPYGCRIIRPCIDKNEK